MLADGHGGNEISKACKKKFNVFIWNELKNELLKDELNQNIIEEKIKEIYKNFNSLLCLELGKQIFKHCGSCLLSCIELEEYIIISHIGDCAAYGILKTGKCQKLTKFHRPDEKEEEERIHKAGGYVHSGRLNGIIAISRSFGDDYFTKKKKENPDSLSNTLDIDTYENVVSCIPDVHFYKKNDFVGMFLMTDGIHDFVDEEFLYKKSKENEDVFTSEIILEARQKGSEDNATILWIPF
jgi:serine/threonine protein phosphatase PrpC